MLCEIIEPDGMTRVAAFESTPVCGEDFCERCGDCLACMVEDVCARSPSDPAGVPHRWVLYSDVDSERACALLSAYNKTQHQPYVI